MNPLVHAELSWLVARPLTSRRDRIIVTLAGVAPDIDGLTILAGTDSYGRYHHVVTHGFIAAVATGIIAYAISSQRMLAFLLAVVSFHLHLLSDLAGSGPGWPIMYYEPFSSREWFWSGQWDLASWQNSLIGLVATLICFVGTALVLRRTIVEVLSSKWDRQVTATLRVRFASGAP